MAGAVLHPNADRREKTLDNLAKHYEAENGKVALMQTWEQVRDGKIQAGSPKNRIKIDIYFEHLYLVELGKRIRKERVLISHIRPMA